MKICFITSLFGDSIENIDKCGRFETDDRYDYYLFTNLDIKQFNTSWKVININDIFLGSNITSNIIKSRYPKFMGWKLLEKYVEKTYDAVFYCDGYLAPKITTDWNYYANLITQHESGLVQQKHVRDAYEECDAIVRYKKDNRERMDKVNKYLLKNNFPNKIIMPENTVFGYNPNNKKLQLAFSNFWNEYSSYTLSHRDQPLWSYILWKNKITPIFTQNNNMLYLFKNIGTLGFNGHKYI